MNLLDVIKRPVVAEKSMLIMDDKKYTFRVNTRTNKTLIERMVKTAFDVGARNVNIVNIHAKLRHMGKYAGYTKKRRKAIATSIEDSKGTRLFEAAE